MYIEKTRETPAVAQGLWAGLLKAYQSRNDTDRLIFVCCKGGSRCRVQMYAKTSTGDIGSSIPSWKEILSCDGYTGRNGIGKQAEGDFKTPDGTFRCVEAFGILEDPGTQVPYTKLMPYHYWSREPETYNRMVDMRKLRRIPDGEHLIDMDPEYHYALVIGYNPGNIVGKGSAIFLHCTGSNPYTAGCIAVSEADMKTVLKNVTAGTRICIYPE